MASFDVVNELDLQELDNAINSVKKKRLMVVMTFAALILR